MHCSVGPVIGENRKEISCSPMSVKMAGTNGIGRQHFQVKTDVRETGIKEILDKICNEEFAELASLEARKKEKSRKRI